MNPTESQATREGILAAAERLFAERGVEGTSVRDITGAAAANLAAINYHFGTKQELVAQVFGRRFERLNQRRLELLQHAEREARGGAPAVEAILEALVRPAVEQSFASGKRVTTLMRLMGRCPGEPNPEVERMMRLHSERIMAHAAAALRRALPHLPPGELFWRMRFAIGAMHHALLIASKEPSPGAKLDADGLVRRLVAFAAAGMRAPAPKDLR